MVKNGQRWFKMVQNGPTLSNMVQSHIKVSQIVQNGPEWSKKIQSNPIWFNMVQYGPKLSKTFTNWVWHNQVYSQVYTKKYIFMYRVFVIWGAVHIWCQINGGVITNHFPPPAQASEDSTLPTVYLGGGPCFLLFMTCREECTNNLVIRPCLDNCLPAISMSMLIYNY